MRLIILLFCTLVYVHSSFALTLQEQDLGRRLFPPFDSGSSTVKLDVTLTSSAAATGAGFILEGTGHVFDSNGFNGKGTGNLRYNTWPFSATVAPQGSLYIQYQRQAVTWSNANNAGYDNLFHDSTGTDTGASRYIFTTQNGGATAARQFLYANGAPNQTRFNTVIGGVTTAANVTTLNSHEIPTYQDNYYATMVYTWKDTQWYWYIDGHLVATGTTSASPGSDNWDFLRIGSLGTASQLLGDFYIKRIQISTNYCPPVLSPIRIAGYGDSFILASVEGTVPGADTVTAINTSQFNTVINTPNFGRSRGQASFMHGLRALAWQNLGIYFPYYVAGKQGGGWEKTPIPVAYRDAVNGYKPELVITLQSVNDVDVATPATDIVANTKTMLDYLIDNNTALRKIIFVVGVSGHQDPAKVAISGWRTEYNRLRLLLYNGLQNYRSKVDVIDVYDAWGGDNYSTYQTIGSSPDNSVTGAGNDVHPSATGHQKLASILWPTIQSYLLARPQRN